MDPSRVSNATSASDSERPPAVRDLPSVDHLLRQPAIAQLADEFPRNELVHAVREALQAKREAIQQGRQAAIETPDLAMAVRAALYRRATPSLRRVINATGIVLHTGLGRAPLAPEAVEAVADVAAGYCNLELDLETSRRGDRHEHVRRLLCELTGAAEALVVNNNAAATFLALHTLAQDRDAVVSRGELVEIGGSYRMPDIMAAAGCRMVEVGTTNRTRLSDYEQAIGEQTCVLLKVHTSNYRIQGYVHAPPLESLVDLGRARGVPVIHDLGSGLLADIADDGRPEARRESAGPVSADQDEGAAPFGGPARRLVEDADSDTPAAGQLPAAGEPWDEPSVRHSVAAGANVTLFSGDKLLGGPQAGIILGEPELLERIRRNPLMRTHRPDKLTLAALEATLRLYRDPGSLAQRLPALRMLRAPLAELRTLAETLSQRIGQLCPGLDAEPRTDSSYAGGGSLPTYAFPTWVVLVRHARIRADALAATLRRGDTPVIGRLHDDALLLDCRTMAEADLDAVAAALADAVRELG